MDQSEAFADIMEMFDSNPTRAYWEALDFGIQNFVEWLRHDDRYDLGEKLVVACDFMSRMHKSKEVKNA